MITTENIFNVLNLLVLLGWIPLFIFPYSRFTKKLIDGLYLPFILCTFYIYFLSQTKGIFSADFSSIAGILDLFRNSTEESAAAGWIHYLAFDYFVGCLNQQIQDWQAVELGAYGILPRKLKNFCNSKLKLLQSCKHFKFYYKLGLVPHRV